MIKAEVVVDGDWLKIGNRSIRMNQYLDWVVLLDGVAEKQFRLLEDAIKHCLEQKYDWSVIPAHVNFMATDEDGMACGWLSLILLVMHGETNLIFQRFLT